MSYDDVLAKLTPPARISGRRSNRISWQEPVDYFKTFSESPKAVLLTGNGPEDISEHSTAAFNPRVGYTLLNQSSKENPVDAYTLKQENYGKDGQVTDTQIFYLDSPSDFWFLMGEIQQSMDFQTGGTPFGLCGAIGYMSYEAMSLIENIAKSTVDNYSLPLFEMILYKNYCIFDHHHKKVWEVEFSFDSSGSVSSEEWIQSVHHESPDTTDFRVTELKPENTGAEYRKKVEAVQEYIRQGEVYEVNLSQQISGRFEGSTYGLFQKIFQQNSAPFSAYMNLGHTTVLCNSPELFLKARGRHVETRPIKGTAPRGRDDFEDQQNRQELLSSLKNQSELYMIVDLMRNDLSRCCRSGSVIVQTPKRLEAYANVHHLVAVVDGELMEDVDYFSLLRATFPGGSITGCPKIRTMEVIDELESFSRNLYTGTIFVMNENFFQGNIVIRTAVVQNSNIYLNAGGAVTIDSDPEEEHQETEHKLASWMRVLGSY